MKAPEKIPDELMDGYTMGGKAKIEYKYANDCSEEIQKIIKSLTSSSIGVLITDHNVRETLKVCDESYILSDGKVISFGKSKEIIKDALVKKVYLGEDFRL